MENYLNAITKSDLVKNKKEEEKWKRWGKLKLFFQQ